jgi:hypothetical protein
MASVETKIGDTGLQPGEEDAACHRAKKRRPTEYTENTELQETEIDATGIAKRRRNGIQEMELKRNVGS